MIKFKSLNQSKQFLKILKKKRLNTKHFTIYFEKNISNEKNKNKILNISFVVKKNIRNAVKRNRIKRKLRNAVRKIFERNSQIDLNYTYVIFGKNDVYKDKFQMVFNGVNDIFKRIKRTGM